MSPGPGGPCHRYRRDLLEVVVDGTRSPSALAALDHLDRCRRCERQLTEISLLVTSLRRRGELARSVTARPDAWERLLARVERSRAAAYRSTWLGRLRLAGGMVSVLLVAVVVWPASTGSAGRSDAPASRHSPAVHEIWQAPAYLRALAEGFLVRHSPSDGEGVVVNYPDGLRPDGEGVSPRMIDWPPLIAT